MPQSWLNENGNHFIYVGDAMCSWCHGFAPALTKLTERFPEIPLHLVMGGLRPYGSEKIADMHDFLKHHWEEVHTRSGQPFSYGILSDSEFIYDTEPASRATVVVRKMAPEKEFEFFKDLQLAFYRDNHRTDKIETYLNICDRYDLDKKEFQRLFKSEEMRNETRQDFQLAQEMGIKGFPSMVFKKGGQFFLISNGYQEAESLIQTINKILAEEKGG